MAISMTGFGQASSQSDLWLVSVQIKSVNHRYCEVLTRMPRQYMILEDRIRKIITETAIRGRFEVGINIEPGVKRSKQLKLDKALARGYLDALAALADSLDIPNQVNAVVLAGFPDVLNAEDPDEDWEQLWAELEPVIHQALAALHQMRETEGNALAIDIRTRAAEITLVSETVAERSPMVAAEYRDRLQTRLAAMLANVPVDENRIIMEAALFADKSNITEEVVRLKSHIRQLEIILTKEKEVGKKLDFLVQEMNREINTMGSKSADTLIAQQIVVMKAELEKIREQVQNLV
jgi:uncharacterized protein (TIGR00255 family)